MACEVAGLNLWISRLGYHERGTARGPRDGKHYLLALYTDHQNDAGDLPYQLRGIASPRRQPRDLRYVQPTAVHSTSMRARHAAAFALTGSKSAQQWLRQEVYSMHQHFSSGLRSISVRHNQAFLRR
jgi:hypothetical protein